MVKLLELAQSDLHNATPDQVVQYKIIRLKGSSQIWASTEAQYFGEMLRALDPTLVLSYLASAGETGPATTPAFALLYTDMMNRIISDPNPGDVGTQVTLRSLAHLLPASEKRPIEYVMGPPNGVMETHSR